MLAPKLDQRYTYGEYVTWDDNECWELIDGVAYNMSPAPSRRHQEVAGEIFKQFAVYLTGKKCKVYYAPFDVRLPQGDEEDEDIIDVVQPDIVVVCDKNKLDSKGCLGAPDLVVEVVSPSTGKRDIKQKFMLYERSGVKEYWIVYPEANHVLIFKLDGGKYGVPERYTADDTIEVKLWDDLVIDLSAVFNEEI
ncbi:hypothetical protein SOV_39580 [Sporomusa ovata DSM 2662]|nr:Uma2 family endonuclease [Sporomusa ovata]EQB26345.1 hypothetical protein SOV_3c02190 [Sporomusa ovata DSM 2662]